jgi:hypothetical protein
MVEHIQRWKDFLMQVKKAAIAGGIAGALHITLYGSLRSNRDFTY